MFEHLKMSKKLKQQLSKVLSIALSVAMLAGTIPADMLGGIADVKAAGNSVSADAVGENNAFPKDTAFTATDVAAVAKDTSDNDKLYFAMPADSTISFSVTANNTGALTVNAADSNAGLKLTKIADSESTEIAAGTWGTLATGNYVLTATAATKLYSISLTLTDTSGGGGGGGGDVTDPTTTVTATVTTTFASGLTSSKYVVKLKEKITGEDTADEKTITDSTSESVTLKKDAVYVVECTKGGTTADNVSVTVNGNTAVNEITASEDLNITVNIAPKETVKASVVITNSTGETTLPDLTNLKLVCAVENCANSDDENVTLTDEGEVSLKFGHQYSLTGAPSGYTATLAEADDGVLTVGEDTKTITVTVTKDDSGDSVTATISVDENNAVLAEDATYTITLENADATVGDSVTYDATDSTKKYPLKPNATYNVKVTPTTIRATVGANKAKTVSTAAAENGEMSIKIDLATQIEAGVSLKGDTAKLPTGAEIKLTNSKVSDDKVTLTGLAENAKVKLWIGDTYNLSCTPEDKVTAKIKNATTYTVAKPTDETPITIEVDVTVSDDEENVNIYELKAADWSSYTVGYLIPAGTTLGTKVGTNGYFKVVTETVTQKDPDDTNNKDENDNVTLSADSGTAYVKVKHANYLEISKWGSGGIQFEVTGTADVEVEMASTGGNKTSIVGLVNENDELVAELNGTTTVDDTATTKLTYKGLSSGKYRVISPYDLDYNRAARVLSIKVTETPPGPTVTEYLFEATELPTKDANDVDIADNTPLEVGTVYKNYFTVSGAEGKVIYRTPDPETGRTIGVDLTKKAAGSIKFRVIGTADVEIEAGSNGPTNYSMIGLVKGSAASTELITNEEGIRFIKSMARTKLTYKNLPSGDYYVVSPTPTDPDIADAIKDGDTDGKSMGRNTRLYSIKVTETTTGEKPPRAEWDEVAPPVIKSVALNDKDKNKIDVTVEALIDYDGGDALSVTMSDKDGNPIEVKESKSEGATTVISFLPEGSGTYKFKASLTRNENDSEGNPLQAKVSSESSIEFVLVLADAKITAATNKGKVAGSDPVSGSVQIEWNKVEEASYYIITIKEKDAAEGTQAREIRIDDNTVVKQLVDSGLTIGKTYTITLTAYREGTGADGGVESSETASKDVEITEGEKRTWKYSNYGLGANMKTNSATGTYYQGYRAADGNRDMLKDGQPVKPLNSTDPNAIRVWSEGGKGKITDSDTDGISLYYTEVDPSAENFKMSGYIHVNSWTMSGGQDGFGLIATDRVGEYIDNGSDSNDLWTNSYMAGASKIKYRWDSDKNEVNYDDVTWPQYEMKIGIGCIECSGVTKENLKEFETNSAKAAATYFTKIGRTLDTSCKGMSGGTYNMIGNYTAKPSNTIKEVTDLKFTIELDNAGYIVSYTELTGEPGNYKEGKTTTTEYYDRDALSRIDDKNVCVGFFAARNADITVENINITTTAYDPTAPKRTRPVEKVLPSYSVTSGATANSADYKLVFSANWEGKVTIKDTYGKTIVPGEYEDTDGVKKPIDGIIKDMRNETTGACTKTYNTVSINVPLTLGTNEFTWVFEPTPLSEEYNPDPNPDYDEEVQTNPDAPIGFTTLSDYSKKTGTFAVTYKAYGKEQTALYVAPNGSALGDGTQANPLDIYTAVKYVQPGQIIYLMKGKTNGVYRLNQPVKIDRGINGKPNVTKDDGSVEHNMIYLLSDPDSDVRPVFDFQHKCQGLILIGDYWYMKGFDVANSANGKDGIKISGAYNVLEQINSYKNGNAGFQISRMYGSDTRENGYWPHDNLVLNCTSYLNADLGFEDADGFAAKLTCGPGNVFDGCIAAYNADDGWDLYAKQATGQIGVVTIRNCIAYKNGYVLIKDTDGDGKISFAESRAADRELSMSEGIETPAGNGNGFKMGGSNIQGGHILKNSVAFYNRSKGIDCNSCPDIKVFKSIGFNNEARNVAFYTGAAESDFEAEGIISFSTDDEYISWGEDENKNPVPTGTVKFSASSDQQKLVGPQATEGSDAYKKVHNDTNYYWDATTKSTNASGAEAGIDWFKNCDFATFDNAVKADIEQRLPNIGDYWVRTNDGQIDMHDFLMLTDKAAVDASLGGEPSAPPVDVPVNVESTDGSISNGNAPQESAGSNVLPEDQEKFDEVTKGVIDDNEIGLWFNIVDTEKIYYTGKAIKPEVHVYDGSKLLDKKGYTITYKNNVNAWVEGQKGYASATDKKAKVPTIIVRGKGNYIGIAKEQHFNINPVALDDGLYVAVKDVAVLAKANGAAQRVTPVVTFNGRKLANKRDYTYEDTKTYTEANNEITITAKEGGNFSGTAKFNFRIISDKNNFASSFKVGRILDKAPGGYYDYEKENPIPVTLTTEGDNAELKVSAKDGTPLNCVEAGSGQDGYSVSYRNNIDVGTATVIITGEGKYAGTKEVRFRIIPTRINTLIGRTPTLKIYAGKTLTDSTAAFEIKGKEYTYAGEAIKIFEKENLNIAVKINNTWTMLEKGVDYTLTYKNNNKAGNATVIIKGIGKYTGSISYAYKIKPLDLSKLDNSVTIGGTLVKNGSTYSIPEKVNSEKGGSRPAITLLVNGHQMDKTQYAVTYRNNTLAAQLKGKKPTVIVTGRGALRGKLEGTFEIQQKFLSDPDVTISVDDVAISSKDGSGYKGNISPRIIIKDANGKVLSAGTDYDKDSITYESLSPVSAGSIKKEGKKWIANISSETSTLKVRVTVEALTGTTAKAKNCGYTDKISAEFFVGYAKQSLRSAKVTVNYGTTKVNGRDRKKTYFDYTGREVKLYQNQKEILDAQGNITGYTYDNTLTVMLNGKELVYGRDFELLTDSDDNPIYIKNINKGTASVTIRGIGEYSGTKVVKYRIGSKVFEWWRQ